MTEAASGANIPGYIRTTTVNSTTTVTQESGSDPSGEAAVDASTHTGSIGFTNSYTPIGSLEIKKEVPAGESASAAANTTFSFAVTLTQGAIPIDTSRIAATNTAGTMITGWAEVQNSDPKKYIATVTLTGTKSLTLSNIPAGTTYEVTETSIPEGWVQMKVERKRGGVATGDETAKVIVLNTTDTVTATNALKGALSITKAVKLDDEAPEGDFVNALDGTYTFTVVGPAPANSITKYVAITVTGGAAVSHKVADSAEGLASADDVTGGTIHPPSYDFRAMRASPLRVTTLQGRCPHRPSRQGER